MELVAEANRLALSPRPSNVSGPGVTPQQIRAAVAVGTAGALLAQAKAAAGRTHEAIGLELGVTRQAVQEAMESDNPKISTLVRLAAVCGYGTTITLRPLVGEGTELTAVLPAPANLRRKRSGRRVQAMPQSGSPQRSPVAR